MHITTHGNLPDLLTTATGTTIRDAAQWQQQRAALLATVVDIEYGGLPPAPDTTLVEELGTTQIRGGNGRRFSSYRVIAGSDCTFWFTLNLWLPAGDGPFPVILNGDGCWRYATDAVVDTVLQRGFALAQFNRTEVAADRPGSRDAVHGGLYNRFRAPAGGGSAAATLPGGGGSAATLPGGDGPTGTSAAVSTGATFGALAAWAWGYHRCVDALSRLAQIRHDQIAVVGHSRGGKASLLAGATDERIALVSANDSGCGGAGCFRVCNDGSETLAAILSMVPYWFGPQLPQWIDREAELPFDQHVLKAAVAPRYLLTTEATGDLWANPHGTTISHQAAMPVFDLLAATQRAAVHYRTGGHNHGPEDWRILLDTAAWAFCGAPRPQFTALGRLDQPEPV